MLEIISMTKLLSDIEGQRNFSMHDENQNHYDCHDHNFLPNDPLIWTFKWPQKDHDQTLWSLVSLHSFDVSCNKHVAIWNIMGYSPLWFTFPLILDLILAMSFTSPSSVCVACPLGERVIFCISGIFHEIRIAARCLWSDRCPCLAGRTAPPQSGNDLERAFDTRGHPPLHPPVTPSGGEGEGGWREKGSPTLCHMRLSKLHHRRVIVRQAAVLWARPSEYDTSSICKQHHMNYGHLHI